MNMYDFESPYVLLETILLAMYSVVIRHEKALYATRTTNLAALFRELTFLMEEHSIDADELTSCVWYDYEVYLEAQAAYEKQPMLLDTDK